MPGNHPKERIQLFFLVMKKGAAFLNVTEYSVVDRNQHFRQTCCRQQVPAEYR